MNIDSVNSINFQARLDVSKVKTNKARWQNIAKIFKEETKLIPDETMKVVEHELDTSITGLLLDGMSNIGKIEAITFNETLAELLEKNSDNVVAKKIAKLLDMGIVADSRKEKAFEKYQDLADKNSWISKDKFIEQRKLEYSKIEEACENKANKDAFLKHFEILV